MISQVRIGQEKAGRQKKARFIYMINNDIVSSKAKNQRLRKVMINEMSRILHLIKPNQCIINIEMMTNVCPSSKCQILIIQNKELWKC